MIPLAKPHIDKKDIKEVKKVLKSGCLSLGPKIKEFEKRFADYIGTNHAIAVSSGTAGLHLCMKALKIKKGDEVITTPFSFIASSNVIVHENAKPVFVDIEKETKNIDPNKIESAITKKTKAILPVHIFGESCDMGKITKIAEKHNLPIIEDACEAIGTTYNGEKVGTFGKASVFAFYPNKQMTTGEGGIVCTNDEKLYSQLTSLRNQGRASMGWLEHDIVGYNYRLNELSCSLGITQIKKIDFLLNERKKVAEKLTKSLKNIPGITQLPKLTSGKSWFVYTINLDKKYNRDEIIKELENHGIQTRPYLPAIHLQKAYKELFNYKGGEFPVCEEASNTSIALPFYIGLKNKEINHIKRTLKKILKNE